MALENKSFTGGLNLDSEDRYVPNGDYRYSLNCRLSKSDGANEGSVENTKGNTLVNISLPNGINKVIGSYDNLVLNKVVYCVFNSQGNHSIFEYDVSASVISPVIITPQLNFRSNKLINDSFMIGGLYFFNDRFNEPGCINIDRAKSNGYPTPFKKDYLQLVVPAPGCAPEAEYTNDSSIKTNGVRGALFQFRYKYVYLDNEESAWSPISKVPLPINEAAYRPFTYYPTDINNAIDITVNKGDDYVKAIKIAARFGNDSDFFLVTEINKDTITGVSSDYTYRFYNDESYTSVDNSGIEGMRLFDWVPQLADSMSLIDGNRIALGGITENYDPVEIDIDVDVNQESSPEETPPVITRIKGEDTWEGYGVPTNKNVFDPNSSWVYSGTTPHVRTIGNTSYNLLGGTQAYRPGPFITPLRGVTTTDYYIGNPLISNDDFVKFNGAIGNRVLLLEIGGQGGTLVGASESLLSEYSVTSPNAVGTRYVLGVQVFYYDFGKSNNKKNKRFNVQHTSVAGDTDATVAASLRQKLIALGTVKEGNVSIDFSKVSSGSYSYENNNHAPSGTSVINIWVQGVVKAADKVNGGSFPTASGPDTAALDTVKTQFTAYSSMTLQNKKSLKSGATHGIGIVYYDNQNRSGLTNVSAVSSEKTFYVPFFTEQSIPAGNTPNDTTISLSINHTAPEWAKRYQLVYTGNQTVEKLPGIDTGYKGFIQFKIESVGTSTTTGAIKAKVSNIDSYNNAVPEDIDLAYSFSKGDRIRVITDGDGNYLQDYRDVEMISYDPLTDEIEFKELGTILYNDSLVEIYTPKREVSEVVYYEIGECFDIEDGLHAGNVPGGDQTSTSPATLFIQDIGDIYLRYRVVPVGATIEDYSYSDYYGSDSWDKGRANIVDNNITKVKRESTIRFSDPYIPETNINGLSTFNDFSFEQYDQQYGTIQRMYSEDKDLLVLQTLKVGKVRVGQDTLYSNEGTQVATVKSQNKVLSDIVYYSGEFGIGLNPESFSVYGNRKYFTDVPRGAVLRLSADGLTPISEIRMHNYFNDTFKRLIDNSGDYRVLGVYDVRFDEYVISIQENIDDIPVYVPSSDIPVIIDDTIDPVQVPQGVSAGVSFTDVSQTAEYTEYFDSGSNFGNLSDTLVQEFSDEDLSSGEGLVSTIPDSSSGSGLTDLSQSGTDVGSGSGVETPSDYDYLYETVAFSETKKRWSTFYSYVPDFMVSNNISLITFKNGQLYTHNSNSVYNNFYGEQFTQRIRFVSNQSPEMIKFYNNINIQATSRFLMPEATNQFGQATSLIEDDFIDDEGVFKASLLRDSNTPNVDNPLLEGDEMRCHSMVISLENTDTELVKLFLVEVGLNASFMTGK
jgi:hypothetical protein